MLFIYVLNLNFCIIVLCFVCGDVKDEVIVVKIEVERKEIEDEYAYRREAVKCVIVDIYVVLCVLYL